MKVTQEYLQNVLSPFAGKTFRLINVDSTNGLYMECEMESAFKMEITSMAILFYVDGDNFYMDRMIKENLNQSIVELGFYSLHLNRMDNDYRDDTKYPNSGKNDIFGKLVAKLKEKFRVNLGKIYLVGIKQITVDERGFTIDGNRFQISK